MLNTWNELRKRRYESINQNSQSTAILCSLIETIATSFGGNSVDFDPKKFLPIRFKDRDLPENKIKEKFKPRTLAILKKLKEKKMIPAPVMRDLINIEGLYEFLNTDN